MSDQSVVEFIEWFTDSIQDSKGLPGDLDIHDTAVFVAPMPGDQLLAFQSVDESGDGRDHLDHSFCDLEAAHRLRFPPQNAQYVVLRRGQSMFPKQPTDLILKLITRSKNVEQGFLLRRLEGSLLPEFSL
jgi:hypothetical protein